MKKYIEAMLICILFLSVVLYGSRYAAVQQKDRGIRQQESKKVENPNPPDEKKLSELGLAPFVSELPVMMIDTHNQQIMKESVIWTTISILNDSSGKNDILGPADDVLIGTIKYRGASSYVRFDKKQYRLKFYKKKNGKKLDYDLFGLGADSEWVLNAPFLDRSLLRNYLVYHLSEEVMEWAPSCTFFELFLDGEYQGVYLAVEPITAGAERLRLSKFGLLSGATPYIVKRDRNGTEENTISTYGEKAGYTGQQLSVEYPGSNKLTQRQKDWIEQDISRFEEALYSDYFADEQIGYAKYIDVDSFADYFILNEFAMNHDAGNLSTYVYRELVGKIQMCVWDFNNGFDNYQWFTMSTDEFYVKDNYWFDRLIQDRSFVSRVVERYRELRETYLSDENIRSILDSGRRSLGAAVERNFSIWGYTFHSSMLTDGKDAYGNEEERDPQSYDEASAMLEATIQRRLSFMDQNMEQLYDNCIN